MKKRIPKRGKKFRRLSLIRRLRNQAKARKKIITSLKPLITELIQVIQTQALPILSTEDPNKSARISSTLDIIESDIIPKFTTRAESIYNEILDDIIKETNQIYIEAGFSIFHTSQATQDVVGGLLDEYLSLIKRIPQDIIQRSRVTLLHAVGAFDRGAIVAELHRISEATDRRIRLIARDQTAKATEAYSRARALDSNFTHYTWKTSHDERVSTGKGGHEQLDNRIYSYTDPTAIIDAYGMIGHPAQRPNCRCHGSPLFLKVGQELKLIKDKKNGDYYEIITSQ